MKHASKFEIQQAVNAIVDQPEPVGDDSKWRGGSLVLDGVLVRVQARYRNPTTNERVATVQASCFFDSATQLVVNERTVNAALRSLVEAYNGHEVEVARRTLSRMSADRRRTVELEAA